MHLTGPQIARRATAYRRHRAKTLWAWFCRLAEAAGLTHDSPDDDHTRMLIVAKTVKAGLPGWYCQNGLEAADMAACFHRDESFAPMPAMQPTSAPIGSAAKIRQISLRVQAGRESFHPDDCLEYSTVDQLPSQEPPLV